MGRLNDKNIDEFLKAFEQNKVRKTYDLGDSKTIDVEIQHRLSLQERYDATNDWIAIQNLKAKDGTFQYLPEFEVIASWYVLIKYYTNIDMTIWGKGHVLDTGVLEKIWRLRSCPELVKDLEEICGEDWEIFSDSAEEALLEKQDVEQDFERFVMSLVNFTKDYMKEHNMEEIVDQATKLLDSLGK